MKNKKKKILSLRYITNNERDRKMETSNREQYQIEADRQQEQNKESRNEIERERERGRVWRKRRRTLKGPRNICSFSLCGCALVNN